MTNLKRVFLMVLVITLLSVSVVFASDVITIKDETNSNNVVNNVVNTTNNVVNTTNNVANTNSTTVIDNANTNTNVSNYNTTNNTNGNLPQTGENDIVMIFAIAIFAVSAVYAYKKIRDYKNI